MEFVLSLAIGVMAGAGVWLLLRPRTFQVLIGLSLLSYAINLFIFSVGSLSIGQEPIVKPGLPADLTINLDQAVYVDGNTVTSTADGRLTLTGQLLNGPTLAGTVNLSRTSITLSESRPASLQALDIEHRNAPPAVLRQQRDQDPAAGRSASAPIALDLTISSPTQTAMETSITFIAPKAAIPRARISARPSASSEARRQAGV